MNIELTLTADDGTPFIMDGCSASLTIFDKEKGDTVLFVDGKIIGNKVNYYIKPEEKEICMHFNTLPSRYHSTCRDCGWMMTDSGKDWGNNSNKWFEYLPDRK